MTKTKFNAVITGASGGIGLEICEHFLKKGYDVAGIGREQKKIKLLNKKYSKQFKFYCADLSNINGILEVKKMIRKLDKIDTLVNCAGINIIKPLAEATNKDFENILNTNVKAPYFISQFCIEKMSQFKSGRIVNIGSIWGAKSKQYRSLYSTTKSALSGLTRGLAAEFSSSNILVNTVSPGFVDTPLTRKSLTSDEIVNLTNKVPIRRLIRADEVSDLVYFLGSHKNTSISGQDFFIDGGFTIV